MGIYALLPLDFGRPHRTPWPGSHRRASDHHRRRRRRDPQSVDSPCTIAETRRCDRSGCRSICRWSSVDLAARCGDRRGDRDFRFHRYAGGAGSSCAAGILRLTGDQSATIHRATLVVPDCTTTAHATAPDDEDTYVTSNMAQRSLVDLVGAIVLQPPAETRPRGNGPTHARGRTFGRI